MKWFFIAFPLLALPILIYSLEHYQNYNSWIENNIGSHYQLLCEKKQDRNIYFAALSGRKIKIGALINVGSNSNIPLSFITSVKILDNNLHPVGTSKKPKSIIDKYVKVKNTFFAESISTYEFHSKNISEIKIILSLMTYAEKNYSPKKDTRIDSRLSIVFTCNSFVSDP